MKAVVIRAYGGPEELKFEERPDPVPGPGEVLVRVAATSVNPFDLKIRSGAFKDIIPLTFPAILGVDVAGIVEALGPGVQSFALGDSVFGQATQTYAQLCVVKAADLARIPDRIDIIEIAALPTVTTTGAQLAQAATRERQRGTVLVTGAVGNVGRSAVFTAKESGWSVIAGVRNKQMQEAKATGADRVIALDDQASLKSLEPVDAIADTISGSISDQLIGNVKNGGVFASTVAPPSNAAARPDVRVETMRVKPAPATLVRMAEAVRTGKLVIPLGRRYPLSDACKAHSAAEKGAAGKLLLLA
ncbi:MAG TPA: NADP-dependent oxidoreductase [Casimicrobiaceae bacterium]|jgi:NADPH:quinone reductase-like Zn-dependent oxidoreductase|nr:NADP-dependent oxidoreductase [Casimicrobiaceae bacterium]